MNRRPAYPPPHRHRFRPVQPGDDGCVFGIRRCDCGETFNQTKRRPAGKTPDQCTWHPSVPCMQHPNKEGNS